MADNKTNSETKISEADKGFMQDALKEQEFLSIVKNTNVAKELDKMIEAYNEQVNQLARTRIDSEIFELFCIMEPAVTENFTNKRNTDEALRKRRKALEVMRRQIMVLYELQKRNSKEVEA